MGAVCCDLMSPMSDGLSWRIAAFPIWLEVKYRVTEIWRLIQTYNQRVLHAAPLPLWLAILAPHKMITMCALYDVAGNIQIITCFQLVVTTIRDFLNKIARNSHPPAPAMPIPAVIPQAESRVGVFLAFSRERYWIKNGRNGYRIPAITITIDALIRHSRIMNRLNDTMHSNTAHV